MSGPTMSKDGTRRVTLRIEWRADLIDLAAALTLHQDRLGQDVPGSMRAVRQQAARALATLGADVGMMLGDHLADDFTGELTDRYQWTVAVCARAFGFTDAEAALALAAMMPERPEPLDEDEQG